MKIKILLLICFTPILVLSGCSNSSPSINYQGLRFYVTDVQAGALSQGYIPWTIEVTMENITDESVWIDDYFSPQINATVNDENYTYSIYDALYKDIPLPPGI